MGAEALWPRVPLCLCGSVLDVVAELFLYGADVCARYRIGSHMRLSVVLSVVLSRARGALDAVACGSARLPRHRGERGGRPRVGAVRARACACLVTGV